MKRMPFVPIPMEKARKVSRMFIGFGESISRAFPALDYELDQAKFDFEPREWISLAFFCFIFYFAMLTTTMMSIVLVARVSMSLGMIVSGSIGFVVGFVTFLYLIFYPKLYVNRRVKDIERNLPHALHHLLVHMRSGVPLFNSLVSISKGNYGLLSSEFGRSVKEISTGVSEVAALEMLARDNPSLYFRRILWQLVNAMKSGADIGRTMKEIVEDLATEQRVSIKKYGSELNPFALFYMMLVVIFPTLGIIFLLILFSFVGSIGMDIHIILVGILGFLVMFQFMFMGLIKSKRPVGI